MLLPRPVCGLRERYCSFLCNDFARESGPYEFSRSLIKSYGQGPRSAEILQVAAAKVWFIPSTECFISTAKEHVVESRTTVAQNPFASNISLYGCRR